jgi:hypothetical protein
LSCQRNSLARRRTHGVFYDEKTTVPIAVPVGARSVWLETPEEGPPSRRSARPLVLAGFGCSKITLGPRFLGIVSTGRPIVRVGISLPSSPALHRTAELSRLRLIGRARTREARLFQKCPRRGTRLVLEIGLPLAGRSWVVNVLLPRIDERSRPFAQKRRFAAERLIST